MCGIAGVMWFGADRAHMAAEAATRMRDALRHRGPDGEGIWTSSLEGSAGVALAHTRLAVIDLSTAAGQPMHAGPRAITYNGEIYNFRSLRAGLEDLGHVFRTASDTEVLLRAWEVWGPACVERLDGMFAFGVWDDGGTGLTLVRDRFGVKPLYYSLGEDVLVFASEIGAVIASGLVRPALNRQALWHYLGYQTTPTPETLVSGVRMLPPASLLRVDPSGTTSLQEYWHPLSGAADAPGASPMAARRRVRELLQASAEAHLVSDVPVGVFLSGGIDSSALVSVLHSIGRRAQTLSVVFSESQYDESGYARTVARAFGADHAELHLSAPRLMELLPEALSALDHPTGDGINTFVVSTLAREHGLKVAWSGLGGDEVFGGYPSFRRVPRAQSAFSRWGRLPDPLREAAAVAIRRGAPSVAGRKLASAVASDGSVAELWPITRQVFGTHERQRLLGRSLEGTAAIEDPYANLVAAAAARFPDASPWALVAFAEARAYMHDVLLRDTDQMSMARALEVRVPLLDHRLAEYVLGLPAAARGEARTPKALLVESLAEPLPDEVVHRPKRGFTLPFDVWMRDGLRPLVEHHLGDEGLSGRGLLDAGEVRRLWQGFLDRRPGATWSRIWTLVALDAWMARHGIAGASRA